MNQPSATNHGAPASAVHAYIEFLAPATAHERPYSYGYEPGADEAPPTAAFEAHRVEIRDIRSESRRLSLDEHGVTLMEHRSRVRDFYDNGELASVYYPEAADVIRAATGADRVLVFDHNVRRGLSLALHPDRYGQGRPVLHAHTDYTETSAVRRLADQLGPQAALSRHRRVLQVNLWRPVRGPLRDFPLAICDASSIDPKQLVAVDLLYPDRRGEIFYLTHDPRQRWYYAADMGVDEAWIFKNYDSKTGGTARFAAHSAFFEPPREVRVDPRESIEVRAFALFDF